MQVESCRHDVADAPHDAATRGTAPLRLRAIRHRRGGVRRGRCGDGLDVEQVGARCQPVPGSRRPEAVVAHGAASRWTHVRQAATDTRFHREELRVEGIGLGVVGLQGDGAVCQLPEAWVAEGDAEAGWRHVREGLRAGTDRVGLHDPGLRPALWGPVRRPRGGFCKAARHWARPMVESAVTGTRQA